MIPQEYTNQCKRTESEELYNNAKINMRILHGILGLTTESAELADQYKKHIFYGKPLDLVNVKEELGDACWYMSILLDEVGTTWEEIWEMNKAKLEARYAKQFTSEEAIERNTLAERYAMVKQEAHNPDE